MPAYSSDVYGDESYRPRNSVPAFHAEHQTVTKNLDSSLPNVPGAWTIWAFLPWDGKVNAGFGVQPRKSTTIWFSQSYNPAVLISHPWLGPSWKNNGLYSQKPLPLCCLVTKSCPTLRHHELQHARLLCPSLSHGVFSNSCPLNQWCHPTISTLLSTFSPALIFPSIRVFSNESVLNIRWPKYWSFSFSLSPSNEYSGLISFRIDWFDLRTVQGTLKSLLQHHSSKTSVLWLLALFMV